MAQEARSLSIVVYLHFKRAECRICHTLTLLTSVLLSIKATKDKCDAGTIALVACTHLKFKAEALDNLKAWSEYFKVQGENLELNLKDTSVNQEVLLRELEEGDMMQNITEALTLLYTCS